MIIVTQNHGLSLSISFAPCPGPWPISLRSVACILLVNSHAPSWCSPPTQAIWWFSELMIPWLLWYGKAERAETAQPGEAEGILSVSTIIWNNDVEKVESVVSTAASRGSGHKRKHRRLHGKIRKHFFVWVTNQWNRLWCFPPWSSSQVTWICS